MSRRFEGKVAIVTGSSNGIGRAIAKLFAAEGAKVTICGRNPTTLKETKDLLLSVGASEKEIFEVIGDLTSQETLEQIINGTVQKFGKIDILVNNAGGVGPDNSPERGFEQSMDVYDYVMTLNLRSVVVLTKLAMPHLIKSQGEVVNISSITGLNIAFPAFPYYGISKAGINQLTRSLAAEYMPKGVRVNAVNPGVITTAIMQKQGATFEAQQAVEAKLCGNPAQTPAMRPGTCDEIAQVVAFLSHRPSSSYIVGHCLVADGGSAINMPILAAYNMDF